MDEEDKKVKTETLFEENIKRSQVDIANVLGKVRPGVREVSITVDGMTRYFLHAKKYRFVEQYCRENYLNEFDVFKEDDDGDTVTIKDWLELEAPVLERARAWNKQEKKKAQELVKVTVSGIV